MEGKRQFPQIRKIFPSAGGRRRWRQWREVVSPASGENDVSMAPGTSAEMLGGSGGGGGGPHVAGSTGWAQGGHAGQARAGLPQR